MNKKTDAEFIVRACNAHDALVKALEEARSAIDASLDCICSCEGFEPPCTLCKEQRSAIERIGQALQLAKVATCENQHGQRGHPCCARDISSVSVMTNAGVCAMVETTELLTPSELADRLKVSTPTVTKWRRARTIPAIRINSTTYRFEFGAVVQALREKSEAAK